MKTILIWALLILVPLCAMCQDAKVASSEPVPTVGVYDSRSVAVAFAGSPVFREWMKPLMTDHEAARESGDKALLAELEKEGQARQDQLHLQGFGTDPVDNILAMIEEKVTAMMVEKGLVRLVSVWDTDSLADIPDDLRVDVTEQLVDLLEPVPLQRERALEIRKHEPVSRKRLEKMRD